MTSTIFRSACASLLCFLLTAANAAEVQVAVSANFAEPIKAVAAVFEKTT